MSPSPEYLDFLLDQLRPLGLVRTRRMFGGVGLFLDGLMFALLDGDGTLYVKAEPGHRPAFAAAGGRPLTYLAKGREVALSYYTIPEDAVEERDALLHWARLGVDSALKAAASARPKRRGTTVQT